MDNPATALNKLFNYDIPLIHKHQAHWREIFNEEYEAYEKKQKITTVEILKLIANSSYGYYDASKYNATYFAQTYAPTWASVDFEDSIYSYSFLNNQN